MSEAAHSVASPHTIPPAAWEPTSSDLKTYRHFDAPIRLDAIATLVRDPAAILNHPFFPLLQFEKSWRRAPIKQADGTLLKRKKKERFIRFAGRKDSYIYKHYREMLAGLYEDKLRDYDLSECVLAYRSIPVNIGSARHKTNIEFAKDAFSFIQKSGKCVAIAIDISKYFDSLDHRLIKKTWCDLLGVNSLPHDHYRVFRNVTRYRYVDRDEAYIALGYSERAADGKLRYLVDPKTVPMQLCSLSDFRTKIVDGDLVKSNTTEFGIPQGLPISDVLANAYLFQFDLEMKAYALARSGMYMRYCDDILLILPGDGRAASGATKFASNAISKYGSHLEINADKTEIACYTGQPGSVRCYNLLPNSGSNVRTRMDHNDGLSYLGFRYDGRRVYLRESTLSNLRGKMARSSRAAAHAYVNRHREKDLNWLIAHRPVRQLEQQFLQVQDFDEALETAEIATGSPFGAMTFWSYARRAEKVFHGWGCQVFRQLRKQKNLLDQRFIADIQRSFSTREARAAHA